MHKSQYKQQKYDKLTQYNTPQINNLIQVNKMKPQTKDTKE